MGRKRKIDRSWIDSLPPDEIRALEESEIERPTSDTLPAAISYSTRAPGDFILWGPLGPGDFHVRRHDTIQSAEQWLLATYPGRVKGEVKCDPAQTRWWALIKGKTP